MSDCVFEYDSDDFRGGGGITGTVFILRILSCLFNSAHSSETAAENENKDAKRRIVTDMLMKWWENIMVSYLPCDS